MFSYILFGLIWIGISTAEHCADMNHCQCLEHYISCRNTVSLPDVLSSRVTPLLESPLVLADLRSNALSQTVLTRFLLVFSETLERVILTEQLESVCPFIHKIQRNFPKIELETECEVSIIFY